MTLTLKDLKDRLSKMEETYLLELLDIDSTQLVEKFEDVIEERFDEFLGELEEGFDPQEDDDWAINPD